MSLNELHARRLATIGNLFDAALDRMDLVLHSAEDGRSGEPSRISAEQAQFVRDRIVAIRSSLGAALERFHVRLEKPDPIQMLVAELSTLWVVLENARPERMTGYGREFSAEDQADWEKLVQTLLQETDLIRGALLKGREQA